MYMIVKDINGKLFKFLIISNEINVAILNTEIVLPTKRVKQTSQARF